MSSATETTSVLMLVFDEMELLDFAGPYEVFTTAARMYRRRSGGDGPPRFTVQAASAHGGAVRARAGLQIVPDHRLADAPACDWLLVPGGVVDGVLAEPDTLAELERRGASAQRIASVCTGAFVLARAGLLRGQAATTHWEDAAELARLHPDLDVQAQHRWVDDGRTISSAGIAAGIDMSLHLVAWAAGTELARATARQMDYPWQQSP